MAEPSFKFKVGDYVSFKSSPEVRSKVTEHWVIQGKPFYCLDGADKATDSLPEDCFVDTLTISNPSYEEYLGQQTKPSNPKDSIGSDKLPLHLVPQTAIALESTAYLEGALKYGRYNWRIAGVRSSIYFDALIRHVFKWWNGEDRDSSTRVHHLASARACLGIIIDAEAVGKLTDDRPPRAQLADYIGALEEEVKFLKHIYAGKNPRQYFIGDGEEVFDRDSDPV